MNALGIGPEVPTTAPLDPIAYDGQTGTDKDAILVDDLSDLTATFISIVGTATGNLVNTFPGADGARLVSVTVEGTTYTYDPGTDIVTPSGGPNNGVFNTVNNRLTIMLGSGAASLSSISTTAAILSIQIRRPEPKSSVIRSSTVTRTAIQAP